MKITWAIFSKLQLVSRYSSVIYKSEFIFNKPNKKNWSKALCIFADFQPLLQIWLSPLKESSRSFSNLLRAVSEIKFCFLQNYMICRTCDCLKESKTISWMDIAFISYLYSCPFEKWYSSLLSILQYVKHFSIVFWEFSVPKINEKECIMSEDNLFSSTWLAFRCNSASENPANDRKREPHFRGSAAQITKARAFVRLRDPSRFRAMINNFYRSFPSKSKLNWREKWTAFWWHLFFSDTKCPQWHDIKLAACFLISVSILCQVIITISTEDGNQHWVSLRRSCRIQ